MIDQSKLETVLKYSPNCFSRTGTIQGCKGCPYGEDEDLNHIPDGAEKQCYCALGFDAIELLKQLVEENNDLYNQLQDKKLVEEASEEILDNNVMVTVAGEPYYCKCGCNVFTKLINGKGDLIYRCHGCGREYEGE